MHTHAEVRPAATRSRSIAERPAVQRRAKPQTAAMDRRPAAAKLAQLAALLNPVAAQPAETGVVQRVINTSTADKALIVPQALDFPTNAFVGLPPTASKTVRHIQATSAPADPGPEMAGLKALGYLADPSKTNNQSLTRMHAIRGKFGGPTAADNMFLGTAFSNNFNPASHFAQVESPLEQYVQGDPGRRAFDYAVTPNFGVIPAYMQQRIASVPLGDRAALSTFAQQHIPDGFTCSAVLYEKDGNGSVSATPPHVQGVSTTVGAPQPQLQPPPILPNNGPAPEDAPD